MLKKAPQLDSALVLINKTAGRTSHDEVAIIKSALRSVGCKSKVGHSGTLDPKVTGLLVVGIGKGTKVLEYMLLSEKQYIGEMIFHDFVTREQLESAIEKFTGTINQLPPRKSSIKREVRERDVYRIEIQEFDRERKKAKLFCAVERGTYIRKLFHDMGEHIGVRSHMGDLHRIKVGSFSEQDGTVTSEYLKKLIKGSNSWNLVVRKISVSKLNKIFLPLADALTKIPKVTLHPGVEKFIGSGADVYIPGIDKVGIFKKGDLVQVITNAGRQWLWGEQHAIQML